MQQTLEKERSKEDETVLEKSTDLSKEDYVKSYSLQPRSQQKDKDKGRSGNTDSYEKLTNKKNAAIPNGGGVNVHNDETTDKTENDVGTEPSKSKDEKAS